MVSFITPSRNVGWWSTGSLDLLDLVEVDAIFFYNSSFISPPLLSQMAHVAGRQMRMIDLASSFFKSRNIISSRMFRRKLLLSKDYHALANYLKIWFAYSSPLFPYRVRHSPTGDADINGSNWKYFLFRSPERLSNAIDTDSSRVLFWAHSD